MGLPKLETCCFIFDLKTGNIILGCINGVLSFILMILMIVVAASLGTVEASDKNLDVEVQAEITGIYLKSIILIILYLAKFCFDVLYVYGVVNERAGIIKVYFFMWTIFFLLSIFTFFLNAHGYSAGTICTEILYIGLNIYAILLSNSFYQQLNSREEI